MLKPLAAGFSFLESPRWHANRLWAVDLYAQQVVSVAPDGQLDAPLDVPGIPTGLGWLPAGQLLVATREHQVLRHDEDRWADLCDLGGFGPAPLNELVVDGHGGVYVAVFGLATGALLYIDASGTASVAATGLLLPNGLALTPDGAGLLVAESAGQRVTAFDIGSSGELLHRRTWAAFGEPASSTSLVEVLAQAKRWPDGIAVDADGTLWVADPLSREVLRVREGGDITSRIDTGQESPNAVALDGPGGQTLFVCAAPPGRREADLRTTRDATLQTVALPLRDRTG